MTASLLPNIPRATLIALMLATLLGALDQTIVAVSLPAISAQFGEVGLLAWVVSGYMVAMTIAVPLYGKLGDLYGRRLMILTGTAVFTVASVACALAQDMPQLIAARVLQGLGAGGMISVSQAIVGDLVPPRERGRYQGYFSGMYAVASVAGPVLGGGLTEYLSWHWVFWVNLPLGVCTWWALQRALGAPDRTRPDARVDYAGAVLLTLGLGSLLLGVTWVGQGHAWTSPAVMGLAAGALIALLAFVAHERRTAQPLMPLHLFGNPVAVLCWTTLFFASFQSISLTMLEPLRVQSLTGAGADSAALHLLPLAMGLPVGAFTGGRLTSRTGRYKPQILTGALLMPVAILGLALTPVQASLPSALCLLVIGIACGLQFPTSLVGAQSAVAQHDMGVVTSTTNLFRSLGGAVGVACMSSALLALMLRAGLGQSEGGDVLLGSLHAQGHAVSPALSGVFRHLLEGSAAVSLLGTLAALALPDRPLRGRS
ncbi:MDR family MFS transporter [Pseudomonas entomophila]|uniref:MDR family MFS transporter n=1 Tax=Pseudomonas entomophila TaxID=312306 RepID=UPI003EB8C95E